METCSGLDSHGEKAATSCTWQPNVRLDAGQYYIATGERADSSESGLQGASFHVAEH